MKRKLTILNDEMNIETLKMIRNECGKHLGLEKLVSFIDQSGQSDDWILRIAFALNHTEICTKKNWLALREKFSASYGPDLCRIVGLEREHFLPPPVVVCDQEQLAHLLALVWKKAADKDYEWDNYVKNVFFCFKSNCAVRTFSLKIKGYL